jgi:hypothetical protein
MLSVRHFAFLVSLSTEDGHSHVIFIFKVERFSRSKGKRTTSRLFLVDLANSELVRKPAAGADKQTVHIFKSIKKSLGGLRKCLHAMAVPADQKERASSPYDESSLTKLLRDALVPGSGGVSLFVTVDKALSNITETMSAIRFGVYAAGHSSAGGETGEGDAVASSRKDDPASSVASQPSTTLPSLPSTATPTAQTTRSIPIVENTPLGPVGFESLKRAPSLQQMLDNGKGSIQKGSLHSTSLGSVSVRTWRGAKLLKPDDAESSFDDIQQLREEIEALRVENLRLTISNQHLNQELTKYRKEGRGSCCFKTCCAQN